MNTREDVELYLRIARAFFQERESDLSTIQKPTFDEMPDYLRYGSIIDIQNMMSILSDLGYYVVEDPDSDIVPIPEDDLITLATETHDLWVSNRISNGWQHGSKHDVEHKRSPYLTGWDMLPDYLQEKSINDAETLITVLHKNGYRLRRITMSESLERYHSDNVFPLIISVSGHRCIDANCWGFIEDQSERLFRELKEKYRNTPIILMTELIKGSDTIVAKVALRNGVMIAPVIAKSQYEDAKNCMENGCDPPLYSTEDLDRILNDRNTLSPCYIDLKMDTVSLHRAISAFMIANSHMMVAVWDGRQTNIGGDTYDAIRMSYEGVPKSVSGCTNPRMPFSITDAASGPMLSSNLDMLIYWIPVKRDQSSMEKFLLDDAIFRRRAAYLGGELPDAACFLSQYIPNTATRKKKLRSYEIAEGKLKVLTPDDAVSIRFGYKEAKFVKTAHLPRFFTDIYDKIDEINGEFRNVDSIAADVLGPERELDPDLYGPRTMARRHDTAMRLSKHYERINDKNLMKLIILTTVSSLLFSLMILMSRSILLTLIYSILYGVSLLLSWRHYKTKEHSKYIEYKLLAENIAVEYHWSVMQVDDTVTNHCPNWSENGLSWLRSAMISSNSVFTNDYSAINRHGFDDRLEQTRRVWVDPMYISCSQMSMKSRKKEDNFNRTCKKLSILSTVISVITTVCLILVSDIINLPILSMEYITNSNSLEITANVLLKLFIVIILNIISFKTMKHDYGHESSKKEYSVLAKIFESADMRLDTSLDRLNLKHMKAQSHVREIFHDLGDNVLSIYNNWSLEILDVDFKVETNFDPPVD